MRVLKNYLVFNGINTSDYGIRISGGRTFGAPERDETVVSIPGKNGDVVLDNGRWKNRTVVYECSIAKNFAENFSSFRSAIMSAPGYHRLEDTYHKEEFYTARLSGAIEPDVNIQMNAGSFSLTFDRKPQRFLKSGEIEIERSSSFYLYNSTRYAARPLLKVNCGNTDTLIMFYCGSMSTADAVVFHVYPILEEAFAGDTEGWEAALEEGLLAYLDAETGEAYADYTISGTEKRISLNAGVEIPASGKLPILQGESKTFMGTTGAGFSVWPRWYTI